MSQCGSSRVRKEEVDIKDVLEIIDLVINFM